MGFFWVTEGSKGNAVDIKDTKKDYQLTNTKSLPSRLYDKQKHFTT